MFFLNILSVLSVPSDPSLPHQAGIELSDFHARVWKSDQGGRNSMQEMHGNQTKCMEFQPIKKTAIFELPYFAQESILVALKACGFDGP